jgi:DNA-binding transcriptional LysR family regulator
MRAAKNPLSGYHLDALLVLLEERSVTRAAQRLNLSQPATSLLLRQLREIFGDPLLVRGQGGMVLTERSVGLRDAARLALDGLDGLLIGPDEFDPGSTRASFTIAMPDHILPVMLNGVVREFRARAPLARLAIRALGPDYDFEGALASGAADIVISNWPTPPANLTTSTLFEDEFVCLVDEGHPWRQRPPGLEDYLAAEHIAPSDYAIAHRGVVETYLSSQHLRRSRRIETSYFSTAPYLLPGTDLVFTVTRHFAEHFLPILPVAIVPSPVLYPRVRFYQLWHGRMQHSPTHRWLRRLVGDMRQIHLRGLRHAHPPTASAGSAATAAAISRG